MSNGVKGVPNWDTENQYNYEDTFLDYGELEGLNQALIKVGHQLKYINKQLSIYEKQKAELDVQYKRKYRASFLNAQATVESHRKIHAEVACEDLELRLIYLEQIVKELQRISYSLRTELDILQTIGHNIRRELNL